MNEQEYLDHLRALWEKHRPPGLPAEPAYPFGHVPLTTYLRRWADAQPDRPVAIYYGAELTYGELNDLSDRFAGLLLAEGFKPGDRVAVFLSNCPQFFIAFYGILKAGCIYVPVNPMFKAHELSYELADAGVTGIVTLDELQPLVAEVASSEIDLRLILTTGLAEWLPDEPSLPLPASLSEARRRPPGVRDFLEEVRRAPRPDELPERDLDDLAALNYTGGTTGMPKGCEHTQGDMVYTAATACSYGGTFDADTISLVFIPMFWIAGEDSALILPVFSGTTVVLLNRWDPVAVMAAVDTYGVSKMSSTVDNFMELLDRPDFSRYDLTSLTGPTAMSFMRKLGVDERRAWQRAVGEQSILRESSYGMTETHTIDTYTTGMQDDDRDLHARPVFVGLPMPGTEFKIVDFGSGELCGLGQEGEIVVRSPSLLKGYWGNEEKTATALRDGWFHTGDIGLLDEEGFLHYLGRNKEMLKVKGASVFPAEVEALLGRHPDVAGCAVVGRVDAERGEVPVAFVELSPGADAAAAEELETWCRANMAPYKVPEIRVIEALPLTATGKVRKEPLRERLGT